MSDRTTPFPLADCPFCEPLKMILIGRPRVSGYGIGDPEKDPIHWHGLCVSCGAEGPKEATPSAARTAWNRRGHFLPTPPKDPA